MWVTSYVGRQGHVSELIDGAKGQQALHKPTLPLCRIHQRGMNSL